MRTKPVYLVIDTHTRNVVRSRQSWPSLESGEIAIRVAFTVPDEIIPSVREFTIEELDAMFTVEAEPVAVEA